MPDATKRSIEKLELFSLNLVEHILKERFSQYVSTNSQFKFPDLLLALARQGKGRGTSSYSHTIEQTVRSYLNGSLTTDMELELRCRIASSPMFKVALERFVEHSLISWLASNNIPYVNYNLSTSADFAVFVDCSQLLDVYGRLDRDDYPEIGEHHRMVLSVDAKSVMALSNLGDAMSRGNVLGRFEANWNQISYIPPLLRQAMESNDRYFNRKHGPMEPSVVMNGNSYLLTSIFACDLVCLSDTRFFQTPLEDLDASYFNHHIAIVTIPNRLLQSQFYDSFFDAGKGGPSEDKAKGFPYYPVDARFNIMNTRGEVLKFENLPNANLRFRCLDQSGSYSALTHTRSEIVENTFSVYDPKGRLS